jgi:toxin FitB
LKAAPEETLFASILTFAEIRRGIELLPASRRRDQLEEWQRNLEASFAAGLLPVTKEIGDKWAILSAQAQRHGTPLAVVDGLIAATAIVHDLTLVTRNAKDFEELDVVLFNPWKP